MTHKIEIEHNLDDQTQVAEAILNALPEVLGIDCDCMDHELEELNKAIYPRRSKADSKYNRNDVIKKYPKAFQELLRWYFSVQDHNINLMRDRIIAVLGSEEEPIEKAVPSRSGIKGLEKFWKPYSRDALKKIRDIIKEHLEGFLYNILKQKPVEHKIKALVNKGIIKDANDVKDIVHDAAVMAKMVDALDRGADLIEAEKLAAARPLSSEEMEGIAWAREKAGEHIRGLFRIVENDVNNIVARKGLQGAEAEAEKAILLEQEERKLKREIGREVVRGKIAGEDWRRLASHLKHHWGDYARDWDRIAFTELSYLEQQGRARDYLKRYGPDVKVIKAPFSDACNACKKLYLNEDGSYRVFTLSELMAYGSNGDKWYDPESKTYKNKLASRIRFDKKTGKFDGSQGGMLPTVGPVHPWCRCVLMKYAETPKKDVPKHVKDDPVLSRIHEELQSSFRKESEQILKKATLKFVSNMKGDKR